MAKLDRSKSYGIVCGLHNGAAFEQGGRHFYADGDEVFEGSAPATVVVPKQEEVKAEKTKPVKIAPGADQVSRQLSA